MMILQLKRTIPVGGENLSFSSSYEGYLIEVEKYVLTLNEPVAEIVRRMEKSTRMFTEMIYGYLPTAGEMKCHMAGDVLHAAVIPIHRHPVFQLFGVGERLAVMGVNIAQVIPRRPRPLRHGVGLALGIAPALGTLTIDKRINLRQRTFPALARFEILHAGQTER